MEPPTGQPQSPGQRRTPARPIAIYHDFSPRPLTTSPHILASSFGRFPLACRGIKFQIRPGTFGNRSSHEAIIVGSLWKRDVGVTLWFARAVVGLVKRAMPRPSAVLSVRRAGDHKGRPCNTLTGQIALNPPNQAGNTLCDRSSAHRHRASTNTRLSRSRVCSAHQ